ncbi:uncharacterized protein ARMOST_12708 [Armillaria ostoyae]|uniref:Uncharacterized protein n=1 Tax=Armillaria ostoyae TaxID=47428 RepID=A0A284RKQ7_ARMOS|nr:uncharacterized protein ARMOST_12708 [Armillaria ostoyae]
MSWNIQFLIPVAAAWKKSHPFVQQCQSTMKSGRPKEPWPGERLLRALHQNRVRVGRLEPSLDEMSNKPEELLFSELLGSSGTRTLLHEKDLLMLLLPSRCHGVPSSFYEHDPPRCAPNSNLSALLGGAVAQDKNLGSQIADLYDPTTELLAKVY